jgi:hypothetical protein
MRSAVFKYGTIAGITMAVLMFATMIMLDKIGYTYAEAIGYACMFIGFLPVFFGTRYFRNEINGGYVSFGRAFVVSVATSLFANLFYVASWLIIYYYMPGFMERATAYAIDQMKVAGKAQKEIDMAIQQMQQFREMYKNPLVGAGVTYTEPMRGTIVFSLITALLLMRKPASLPPLQ